MTAEKKETSYPDLHQSRIQTAESKRSIYQVCVEEGTPREALRKADYWKHVSQLFQPYTKLEVVTDDGEYYCELLVLNASTNWASVIELSYVKLGSEDLIKQVDKQSDFGIKYKGPHKRFVVYRIKDGAEIKDKIQTRDAAAVFLQEYQKVVNK